MNIADQIKSMSNELRISELMKLCRERGGVETYSPNFGSFIYDMPDGSLLIFIQAPWVACGVSVISQPKRV